MLFGGAGKFGNIDWWGVSTECKKTIKTIPKHNYIKVSFKFYMLDKYLDTDNIVYYELGKKKFTFDNKVSGPEVTKKSYCGAGAEDISYLYESTALHNEDTAEF